MSDFEHEWELPSKHAMSYEVISRVCRRCGVMLDHRGR